MEIREVRESDAENLLNLQLGLDQETEFMWYEEGERSTNLEQAKTKLADLIHDACSTVFVVETEDDQLAGYVLIDGERLEKIRHCARLVIGIREAYQGQGIGKTLLNKAIKWAKENGVKRLELTVMTTNRKALWLYSTVGFSVEGTRRKAIKQGDRYVDEFYMSLLL